MTSPYFSNLSINKKLAAIIIFSCLLVSLLASSFFIGLEIISHRRTTIEDLSGLAKVIAINCIAPLEFMDHETASEILSSLAVRPHIIQATLYSADSKIFAQYRSTSLSSQNILDIQEHLTSRSKLSLHEFHNFHNTFIDLSIPIEKSGNTLGALILVSDQDEYRAILTHLAYAIAGILIATLLLATFFSSILNRVISRPILTLSKIVERVHKEENYSIRAVKTSGDELGTLVKGVNSMLEGIERRDRQLIVAKKIAEDANRAKSQFLAQMSHEIRTPMNGVLGIASLLLNTSLNEKQSEFVHTIQRSGNSLLSLINDILDFSKIEAGKLELEDITFNFRELVEDTVDTFKGRSNEKHINLTSVIQSTAPLYITGDPGRLRQVLVNLLGNAIKFTNHGGVSLHISSENENNSTCLRFEIKDSGLGIKQEKQELIFSAFSQEDGSTTRQFGGTGLGLAICQQLVHLMKGKIGVESIVGQGALFWFTALFTIGSSEEPSVDEQQQLATPEMFNAKILVAEDNATNQIVAEGMLEYLGCRVNIVENGQAAVIAAEKESFDLIFMDCQMPTMDGYEATRNIRKMELQEGKSQIPIIALTANAMKGDKKRCLAAGMNDYIPKPFNEQQLVTMLSNWLPGQD